MQPVSILSFSPLRSLFDDGAAGVDKDHAVAAQALQDKALAAEQPGPEAFGEGDAHFRAQRGAQERVLLADQLAAWARPGRWR